MSLGKVETRAWVGRLLQELTELHAALAEDPPAALPTTPAVATAHVEAPPTALEPEVLPKPQGPAFVGKLFLARAGGPCCVCGGQIEPHTKYLWDASSKRGAHFRCGREAGT